MILTVQVYDAFLKYIEKRTTSSIWQEVNEAGIRLPYITVCPSYNKPTYPYGPLYKFPHLLAVHEDKNGTNITEKEIEDYWLSKTFDAREGVCPKKLGSSFVSWALPAQAAFRP